VWVVIRQQSAFQRVGRSWSLNSVSAGISILCLDSSLQLFKAKGLLIVTVCKFFI
jgi:hypothetical protein